MPGIIVKPLIEPEFGRQINLVTMRGRPHSPAVGAFIRAARAHKWPEAVAPVPLTKATSRLARHLRQALEHRTWVGPLPRIRVDERTSSDAIRVDNIGGRKDQARRYRLRRGTKAEKIEPNGNRLRGLIGEPEQTTKLVTVVGQQVEPQTVLFGNSLRPAGRVRRNSHKSAVPGLDCRQHTLQHPERFPTDGGTGAEDEGDDDRTEIKEIAQADMNPLGTDELKVGIISPACTASAITPHERNHLVASCLVAPAGRT